MRRCSRTACVAPAVATLTYVYADQMAVLGPLAYEATPGSYDLCAAHAQRTSVPRGWEVVRLPHEEEPAMPEDTSDDLMALADAVRQIGLRDELPAPAPAQETISSPPRLTIVRD